MKNRSRLLATPYIVWMLLFTVIPLAIVVFYAFTDGSGRFSLSNITSIGSYLPIFLRSIWYSIAAAGISLLLGYPVAYFIANCSAKAQRFLYMLVMLPMCMSFLLRTLAWVALLDDTGIINSFVQLLGLKPLSLTRKPAAVIFGMVYNYLPYMIMPLYTVLMKIDHRLIEASQDLGCNASQTFTKVVLPLSVPGIISGVTMVFVPAVSTFYISQKLGNTNMQMIGDVVEQQYKASYNPNLGAALSLVLMVLIFVCVGVMNRFTASDDGEGLVTI